MPGTTSTALPTCSHDQHHKTAAAERKGGGWCLVVVYHWLKAAAAAAAGCCISSGCKSPAPAPYMEYMGWASDWAAFLIGTLTCIIQSAYTKRVTHRQAFADSSCGRRACQSSQTDPGAHTPHRHRCAQLGHGFASTDLLFHGQGAPEVSLGNLFWVQLSESRWPSLMPANNVKTSIAKSSSYLFISRLPERHKPIELATIK